jgi:DNA (cytosine-5)-methyltransferase 1
METSETLSGETLSDLTLFVVDTLANPLAPQANDEAQTTPDTYGQSCLTPFATYDPDTHYWKTLEDTCLWGSEPYSQTLPASGLMQSGRLFLQPRLVRHTKETGYSLWPTPTAAGDVSNVNGKFANLTLGDAVRLWPTPTASDWKGRGPNSKQQGLSEVVKMWPTPRAAQGESRNHTVYERSLDKPQNLENRLAQVDPATIGGKLNPTWVEWLMGFPTGWTDLED